MRRGAGTSIKSKRRKGIIESVNPQNPVITIIINRKKL